MPRRVRSAADMENDFVIAVVGGAIMDLVYEIDRMPDTHESLDAHNLALKPGGRGSNTAIAIYRAQHEKPNDEIVPIAIEDLSINGTSRSTSTIVRHGACVYLNTNVGGDKFGEDLKGNLEKNHVNIVGVESMGQEVLTGTRSVFVNSRTKESSDIGYQGANADWRPSNPKSTTCLAEGNMPDLVVCHLETKRETIEDVLAMATQDNVPTLFNPSPVTYILTEHYKNMTHLILNRNEAAELSGKRSGDLASPEALGEAAKNFLSWGVQNVVITLGDKGAYYATNSGMDGFVDAEKVANPRDSTGAGDTFVGYYAMEFVRQNRFKPMQWDIRQAVEMGCKAAARTILEIGAQDAIPWANEIET